MNIEPERNERFYEREAHTDLCTGRTAILLRPWPDDGRTDIRSEDWSVWYDGALRAENLTHDRALDFAMTWTRDVTATAGATT